jgi:hypothetical protein
MTLSIMALKYVTVMLSVFHAEYYLYPSKARFLYCGAECRLNKFRHKLFNWASPLKSYIANFNDL